MTDSQSLSSTRDVSRARVLDVPARITERDSPVTFGLRSFRCLVAARLSAIWLIMLVASPWTAPFATCGLATFWNHTSDSLTTVSSEPGTETSTGDLTGSVTPPASLRSGRLRLEHCIGEWSVILPITPTEVPLEQSNRPSPPGSHSSTPSVLRL